MIVNSTTISDKINNAKLETHPWNYKFIENIFPEELYEKIIYNLPSKDFYHSRVDIYKNAKSINYNSERYVFPINDDNLKLLLPEQGKFWANLYKLITSKEFMNSILNTFKNSIDLRLKNLSLIEKEKIGTKNFRIFPKAEIVKDLKKYHLGAHTDNFNKLITFLFYLPKDNSIEKLGTTIYKSKVKIDPVNSAKHQSIQDTKKNFEKIKTCNFIPNSLLIFPRTNESFHGVEEINEDSRERDLLLLNYYIKGN